jgi:hypothetical protein
VVDDLAVAAGCGMVELVDDDVVELVGGEVVEACRQRRDAGEDHAGVASLLCPEVQAERLSWLHLAEGVAALAQDLFAVGDEQDPAELGPSAVEGGDPGLAESGGHHHQAGSEAVETGGLERLEGSTLDGAGRGRLDRWLDLHADRHHHLLGGTPLGSVPQEPLGAEGLATRVAPQPLEGLEHRGHLIHADGPFDPTGQPGLAQVVAADEACRHSVVRRPEQVRLGMEAGGVVVEDAGLQRAGCATVGQVEQPGQGVGVGDLEVVGREDPETGATIEGIGQRLEQHVQARPHHEADDEVDSIELRSPEPAQQLQLQQAVLAVDETDLPAAGGRALGQVVPLRGDHVAHPSPGVGHVTGVARDDVDVEVLDGLPCGRSGVEADVVAIGATFGVESLPDLVDERHEVRALLGGRFPPRRNQPAGDDQRVAG